MYYKYTYTLYSIIALYLEHVKGFFLSSIFEYLTLSIEIKWQCWYQTMEIFT